MDHAIFYQLSFVLALTTVVALAGRLMRQPPIISYIITGFLVGPTVFGLVDDRNAFETFSQIGVTLLLFMVGLGLNVGVIKSTGKPVLFTFLVIAVGLGTLGYGLSAFLGFSDGERWLMAIALLFSSTIIVVKALSDRKGLSRLYGQLALGVLLLEDIVATIALLFVSATAGSSTTANDFIVLLIKGGALAAALTIAGAFVMPRLTKTFATSQELLYLFAIAWAFGVASAFWWAGFSIEIGALFAGVALAHLPYAQQVATRLRPLRDFFIVLFFIGLGLRLGIDGVRAAIVPALIFAAVVMTVKPLLTLAALGVMGYTKQTSFKSAIYLSQISEFSIIMVALANGLGLASNQVVAVITLTMLITNVLSTYLVSYDEKLYRKLEHLLSLFERPDVKEEVHALGAYPLVLLGYHKGGHEFIRSFRKMKKPYVALDYDPEVIEELEHQHINHIYGDATDLELLDEIGVHKSELVISTIADNTTNKLIVGYIMHHNPDAIFICHADSYDTAEALYKKGAAYVIVPHYIGSEQINSFIRKNGSNKQAFAQYRRHHLTAIGEAVE
ncbi:MAG TPA: cation:proton antiporter [Candidatus Saccharimonadales bacterium]|nr:cation:proton antiporter [Candidatus Saccharimonadales bacterium]